MFKNIINVKYIVKFLFEDYRFIVEKRFACPSDPGSCAGGSVSSW
jgi:hypothetical protein